MTSVTVHLSKIVMLQKTKKDDVNVILLQIKEHQYKHILSKKKKNIKKKSNVPTQTTSYLLKDKGEKKSNTVTCNNASSCTEIRV